MRPSRSLGQVFLKDEKYIKKILDFIRIQEEIICEIGPGRGELTRHLIKDARKLCCVEIDPRLSKLLKESFSEFANFEIVNSDILKFSLSRFGEKIVVFGNIPYQISNYLIRYLVSQKYWIKRAYLSLQKEFAQKLIASPSTKSYSFLTCYIQYYGQIRKPFDIPAQAFFPRPKVDSSFIEIEFYPKLPYKVKDEDFLFRIIRKAFSQRRKKIINSLPVLKANTELLLSLEINPQARAENLSLKDYVNLANAL